MFSSKSKKEEKYKKEHWKTKLHIKIERIVRIGKELKEIRERKAYAVIAFMEIE